MQGISVHTAIRLGVCCLVAFACALPTVAQDAEAVDAPPPVLSREVLVENLDNPSFEVRESATSALLADDTIDEPALRQMLLAVESLEARHRLLALARHHTLRLLRAEQFTEPEEAGAIGFSYDALLPKQNPHADHAGVLILRTLPGFPGHVHLRPNDVILEINGQPCRGNSVSAVQEFVRSAIAWKEAGQTHRLTVVREGEQLELEVPCVAASALGAMYTTSARGSILQNDFEEAWTQARERLLADLPEPIELTPDQ